MCRCVRQLLPERLRRVKVAQACRAFLAAAQRGREHAAGIGERRGRKLCIVVGRRDVVNRMMSNVRQNLRYSGLAALLAEALPPEQEKIKED